MDTSGAALRQSRVLLNIHRAALDIPFGAFQQHVLSLVQEELPFEKAWWGVVSGLKIHTSVTLGLPDGYPRHWERIKDHDPIAVEATSQPNRTVVFNHNRLKPFGRTLRFLDAYGIRHVLCTTQPRETLNVMAFLSLYRSDPSFEASERVFKQCLMPHLTHALTVNWMRHLETVGDSRLDHRPMAAICDQRGLIYAAEQRFHSLIQQEWPAWKGPYLPKAMTRTLMSAGRFDARRIQADRVRAGGLFLVRTRRRSPFDVLTARERDVVDLFSRGMTHKEIARDLALAPATVRHYIRNAYAKLGISDKAALGRLIALDAMGAED